MNTIPELKSMLRQSLMDLLAEFMRDAGYILKEASNQRMRFEVKERKVDSLIFTSIKSLDLEMCCSDSNADNVILVPSAKSLEPFMQFFKEHDTEAEEKGVQIWVANMERGTMDPFIGYTRDLDIYRQFKNPRPAEMVHSNWKK